MQSKKYQIVNTKSLLPIPCPCGTAKRAFIEDPDQVASLHVVDVQQTAKTHYHKKTTEIYYILEGQWTDRARFNAFRCRARLGDLDQTWLPPSRHWGPETAQHSIARI